jgi:hypothetical protein
MTRARRTGVRAPHCNSRSSAPPGCERRRAPRPRPRPRPSGAPRAKPPRWTPTPGPSPTKRPPGAGNVPRPVRPRSRPHRPRRVPTARAASIRCSARVCGPAPPRRAPRLPEPTPRARSGAALRRAAGVPAPIRRQLRPDPASVCRAHCRSHSFSPKPSQALLHSHPSLSHPSLLSLPILSRPLHERDHLRGAGTVLPPPDGAGLRPPRRRCAALEAPPA